MPQQASRTVFIQNRLGLHARAAVKLVELAQSFDAVITIQSQEGKQATADSVMGLLMLDSAQGQMITILAKGSQADLALDAVCHLIEAKFDEDE
ncbi:HPr family phosphocarrier protein [Vibrio cincinnatiensis]|jgi:phosphocarrier protein NPr|uniref:HPr-like nitrogen-regulatory protein NPr n=1 Tax=Vibrio cincinnatiensis DSM 19608 TaxID=1123491 RepID=A0A1T4QU16_VIBCI|nr:HPr family phosphocarrier protein [Vibrio cincinnatiensis]MCG3722241.1 HPr family phosphocarrier protein [Vibrio cincinnatiensis]MCG3725130.1 HPr family phosphocarrier protein [Vibrio cincinnatiensis]MCG3732174.1 HPr family phosphocarrier protein [Vibrio cincinnatiensis]MCG3735831.1 HPr family phosphocarrier protein [Vibrio cincinnatiensis]MCG3739595.1 HPr family phosphocarrier protein [Vibrio cincinnatiensis]